MTCLNAPEASDHVIRGEHRGTARAGATSSALHENDEFLACGSGKKVMQCGLRGIVSKKTHAVSSAAAESSTVRHQQKSKVSTPM